VGGRPVTSRLTALPCLTGILGLCASAVLLPSLLCADDRDAFSFAAPTLSAWTVRGSAGVEYDLPVEATNSTEDFSRTTEQFSLAGVVWKSQDAELQLNGQERISELRTDAVFPSGLPLPDQLQETRVGFLYKRLFGGGWDGGASASIGSWSDSPLTHTALPIVNAALFLRMPSGQANAWIFSLSYSNERSELNDVPVPGVEFAWTVDPTLQVLLGFPVESVVWKPSSSVRCDFIASGFGYLHLGGSYAPFDGFKPLRVLAAIDFGGDRFQRQDPADPRDLIFFRALTYSVGAEVREERVGSLSASVGYATQREIIEGHSFTDTANHLDVANGVVLRLSAEARF
jgi:hypothetical protein